MNLNMKILGGLFLTLMLCAASNNHAEVLGEEEGGQLGAGYTSPLPLGIVGSVVKSPLDVEKDLVSPTPEMDPAVLKQFFDQLAADHKDYVDSVEAVKDCFAATGSFDNMGLCEPILDTPVGNQVVLDAMDHWFDGGEL